MVRTPRRPLLLERTPMVEHQWSKPDIPHKILSLKSNVSFKPQPLWKTFSTKIANSTITFKNMATNATPLKKKWIPSVKTMTCPLNRKWNSRSNLQTRNGTHQSRLSKATSPKYATRTTISSLFTPRHLETQVLFTPRHMETRVKNVHFQEYVVIFNYKYNQPLSVIKTSPLIDDRSDHVTPFAIKRQQLRAKLHSIHLRRKERQHRH